MAKAGQVLENSSTGQRIVFRRTAQETQGELLEYELFFRPGGFLVQEHVHPRQSERHEVLAGRLGLVLAGEEKRLGPGGVVVVPAGTPHRLFPIGEEQVHAVFELRPALQTEAFMEALHAGRTKADGSPTIFQLAVVAQAFPDVGHPTRPPLAVQRIFTPALAAVGRLLGYRVGRVEATPGYVFTHEWDVDAPAEAVFDVLADAGTYPEWWKPVYIEAEADGPPAVGVASRQYFKGRLPYRLRTVSTIVRLERPREIQADVVGDLSGRGTWTLSEKDGRTHVHFDWRVNADRPLLRYLTPVLKPLFRWNHDWAVARAIDGLEPYVRARLAAPPPS